MEQQIEHIRNDLIFQAGQIATKMRLSKSMGQLYAALYFSTEPVSLDDLAKICKMSKGNASINIRNLERWNAVNKTFSNSNRRDYYVANKDVVGFSIDRGIEIFTDIIKRSESLMSNTLKKIEDVDTENIDDDSRKQLEVYKTQFFDINEKLDKLKKLSKNLGALESMLKGIL